MSNHNQNLINKVTVNSIINTYEITKTMKKYGVCLIPNYISDEKCNSIKIECAKRSEVKVDTNFEDGSYRRYDVYKNTGAAANKRVYHTDCFSNELMEFKIDKHIQTIC